MKTILNYLNPQKRRIAFGLTVKIIGTMAELFLPYILTHILKNVINRNNIRQIIFYGIIMLIFSIIACLGNIIANRNAAKVTTFFSKELRRDLFKKTLFLSASDTDSFTIPSLESRITTDTYNVHNFVGMMQRMGIRAPILLLGGITLTLIMDPALALVMIATLPVIFFTVYGISRKGVPLYSDVQRSQDNMVRVAREDTQGIRVIKALSKNEHENNRYDKVNRELSRKERKAGIIMGVVNPVMTLLMNLGIAAVVAVAAFRVAKNLSSSATVIAFMQYFTLVSMAMMSLSRMFVMYTKCAASASRISEVLNTDDSYKITADDSVTNNFHISFDNVSFSYFGKKNNLTDISFNLNKGEHLGIIGATGSGKTTIIKLLLRFYEPSEGEIRINGKSITSYSREELTSMFGTVLQNDFIYSATIAENISFGREVNNEEIIKASKIAQAYDFIESFEDKFNHQLSSKGTNISGGQRQRILIARAIALCPEILILDDASSALDYKTDALLRKALNEHMADSTVITIAQRVSSVKNCDKIIVLDGGSIIGFGTHDELLATCSEYKEISDSQMGGAFVE